jgi:hypothetical protein
MSVRDAHLLGDVPRPARLLVESRPVACNRPPGCKAQAAQILGNVRCNALKWQVNIQPNLNRSKFEKERCG